MQRVETLTQSQLRSSLGSHEYNVFSLVANVFNLVVKPNIIKFWLLSLIWPWRSRSITPKTKGILKFCTSGPNVVNPSLNGSLTRVVVVSKLFVWTAEDYERNYNKTDVGRRQTLGHPRSINPNMINHVPNNHLSFSKSNMLSVHEAIKISYSYHLPCQGSRNCQSQIYVSNHSFVDMVWSPFQYCPSIQQIYLNYQNVIYP